jgi:hypothetical protein
VREGGVPKSQGVSRVCVTLLVSSQGRGELFVRVSVSWNDPTRSFCSLKEVQGYKMLVRGVILVGEGAQRP